VVQLGRKWKTPSRGDFEFDEMIEAIKKFVLEDTYHSYKIYVGTDSQRHGRKIKFVSSIVILREGNGGQYYYYAEEDDYFKYKALNRKIKKESDTTFMNKFELKQALENFCIEYDIPIIPDIDIGDTEKNETRKCISEATSIFKGEYADEQVRIKPYSIASSCVANKHSK
jgi:predicted RNase H-related nuclease YkuK (DUF458 family)